MQRTIAAGSNEGKRNRGAQHAREFLLRLLSRFRQPLQGLAIAAQINLVLLFKGISQPVDDALIEIVAAELRVTVRRLDVKNAIGDAQQRHVKGAATKVEDQDPFDGAAVKAIGQSSCSGLIEDALHRDARQPSGVTGGLALCVVEVSGHGHHCRFHRFTQISGRVIDKLANDAGHQFFGRVFPLCHRTGHPNLPLVVGTHRVGNREAAVLQFVPVPADEPLQVREGVAGAEHQLAPGQLTHQQFLILGVSDNGWGGSAALGIGDHVGTTCLQHSDNRIGGPQIDSDDPPHIPENLIPTLTAGSNRLQSLP